MTLEPRAAISAVEGPALVLPGNDIDTDRIVPARFLKTVTFDGLETHVFADDRREAAGRGVVHPFDDPARRSARVLVVGANFGCGSSREHAPQALLRWGIAAIVGVSFADIFFTNALAVGLPCVTAPRNDLDGLRTITTRSPDAMLRVDIEALRLSGSWGSIGLSLPDAARRALLAGDWYPTARLLDGLPDVERLAATLPYFVDFA